MLIRVARDGDLAAIAQFAEVAVHDTYDPLVGAEEASRLLGDWWGSTLAASVRDELVHVATSGDEVIGVVERGLMDGEPIVWKLYVAPVRRGEGIGARLLHAAIDATDPRAARIILEHIAANVDAGRFYLREGFEVFRIDESDDPGEHLVWRARRLGGPPG